MKIVVKNNTVLQIYNNDKNIENFYLNSDGFEIYYISDASRFKLNNLANITENEKLNSVRYIRNKLLQESDYLMLSDIHKNLSIEKIIMVENYRQALRDLPNTVDLNNVEYPIKPEI